MKPRKEIVVNSVGVSHSQCPLGEESYQPALGVLSDKNIKKILFPTLAAHFDIEHYRVSWEIVQFLCNLTGLLQGVPQPLLGVVAPWWKKFECSYEPEPINLPFNIVDEFEALLSPDCADYPSD